MTIRGGYRFNKKKRSRKLRVTLLSSKTIDKSVKKIPSYCTSGLRFFRNIRDCIVNGMKGMGSGHWEQPRSRASVGIQILVRVWISRSAQRFIKLLIIFAEWTENDRLKKRQFGLMFTLTTYFGI